MNNVHSYVKNFQCFVKSFQKFISLTCFNRMKTWLRSKKISQEIQGAGFIVWSIWKKGVLHYATIVKLMILMKSHFSKIHLVILILILIQIPLTKVKKAAYNFFIEFLSHEENIIWGLYIQSKELYLQAKLELAVLIQKSGVVL